MAYRRHFFTSVAAFIVVAAVAQVAPKANQNSDSCTDEDYAIYSLALNDLLFAEKPSNLVLIDQTSTGVPPGMAAMTQFGGKAQPLLKKFSPNAQAIFESRNKSHAVIDANQIKTAFPILMSVDDAKRSVAGGWKEFHKKYPHSGINLVSLPAYNEEHSRALLYLGTSCGMLCGNGVLMLLEKDGENWKVAEKVVVWVS